MRLISGGAALIAAFLVSQMAMAQDVTLTARNGGLSLSGQLLAYDGEFYRVETDYGRLTVDAEGVICEGPACPELTAPLAVIRIVGAAEAAGRLLPPLFAGFAASRGLKYQLTMMAPEFTAEITDPTTDQPLAVISFAPVLLGEAMDQLRAEQVEMVLSGDAPPGFQARALALDPLIPIMAAENHLPKVSSRALASALTGEVDNWQALGGPDMPIVVHGLVAEHPLQHAAEARLGGAFADGPRHLDAASLAAAVARDPWALALTGQSSQGDARAILLTDSCDFPLPATALTVKAEDYPLTAPLFLLTPNRRMPLLLREFLEYLATDKAGAVIAAQGYVDRRLGRAPLTEDGQRLLGAIRAAGPDVSLPELQRLAAAMGGGDRLSLTFRFQDGSAQLDALSLENLGDLARQIAAGRFAGEVLTLAGFSDGSGAANVNLALSKSRAEAVLLALKDVAPDLTTDQLPQIEAFGEALPMACDTTASGRQINRRVELWAHPTPPPPAAEPK
jgi:phosphate transport system substrate-binding protein